MILSPSSQIAQQKSKSSNHKLPQRKGLLNIREKFFFMGFVVTLEGDLHEVLKSPSLLVFKTEMHKKQPSLTLKLVLIQEVGQENYRSCSQPRFFFNDSVILSHCKAFISLDGNTGCWCPFANQREQVAENGELTFLTEWHDLSVWNEVKCLVK